MTKKQISTNPVAAILAKVGDVNVDELQRARTPEQLWSKTIKAEIDDEFNLWFASSGLAAKTQRAAARQKWVDKRFKRLDKEEQKRWKKMAEEEKERRASAKEAGKEPLRLLDPVECQRCVYLSFYRRWSTYFPSERWTVLLGLCNLSLKDCTSLWAATSIFSGLDQSPGEVGR